MESFHTDFGAFFLYCILKKLIGVWWYHKMKPLRGSMNQHALLS